MSSSAGMDGNTGKKPALQRQATPRLSDRHRLGKPQIYVYAWGRGDFSQLGLGDTLDRGVPTLLDSLEGKDIVHVAAGEYHTAFLTGEGEVYCVGNNESGQLGFGGREGSSLPVRVAALDTRTVVHLACGSSHTVAVTDLGSLASWGLSEFGQLGLSDSRPHSGGGGFSEVLQPRIVKGSKELRFTRVACGANHTLALTGSGEVYSFGQGTFGALGHGNTVDCNVPTQVSMLWGLGVVQVTCGESHSAALTIDGQVFTWGRGKYGQLGLGSFTNETQPVMVSGLSGHTVGHIACGGDHTLAVTTEGALYSWGRGHWGQTGHGTTEVVNTPKQVEALIKEKVTQVSAGVRHSLAMVEEGQRVFGWGDGEQFQLGKLASQIQAEPTLIQDIPHHASRRLLFVVAGGEHSAAIYGEVRHKNYSGEISSLRSISEVGEEGVINSMKINEICKVDEENLHPAGGPEESREQDNPHWDSDGQPTSSVFSSFGETKGGGEQETPMQTFDEEMTEQSQDEVSPQITEPSSIVSPETVTTADLTKKESTSEGTQNLRDAKQVGTEDVLNKVRENSQTANTVVMIDHQRSVDEHGMGVHAMHVANLQPLILEARALGQPTTALTHAVEDIFSSAKFLWKQFKLNGPLAESTDILEEVLGLDFERIKTIYQGLLELYEPQVLARLASAMGRLLEGVERHMGQVPNMRWIRALLILLQNPLLGEKGVGNAVSARLCTVLSSMPVPARKVLVGFLKTYPKEIFGGRFVRGIHRFISNREAALGDGALPTDIVSAVSVLSILFDANKEKHIVPVSEFYSSAISNRANLKEEYIKWRHLDGQRQKKVPFLSFCQAPFVLTPDAKSKILQAEATLEKNQQVQASIVQHVFGNTEASPILLLAVRRNSLIQDALQQLAAHQLDLKKPLKVVFSGEDAIDEGGVSKEFFQLLVRDLFNVSYGMFVYDDEARTFWFNSTSMESELEFQLVGVTMGLAIYNGVILDVHFPIAVYKKLMEEEVGLDDLKDVHPDLWRGFHKLLEYEGDVETTMAQTFQVEFEYFGERRVHDLLPDGGNMAVTNENREKYVELYVKYILEDSIKDQFAAFSRGFLQVCGGPAFSLFQAQELELLVCGLPHFDFEALERVVHYDGGYSRESPNIRWFWEVVHRMPFEDKKKLLFFTTGNDRSPIGGLGSLKFIIMRNGGDTDRLPTAHTCFNVLMLPQYSSKEKLEGRLKLAIQNATGFGLQ